MLKKGLGGRSHREESLHYGLKARGGQAANQAPSSHLAKDGAHTTGFMGTLNRIPS